MAVADKRNKQSEEARKERKAYEKRKEFMLDFERKNYDKIVFFLATRGFYVAGGHSAVILFNKIGPELDMSMAMKKDTDYGDRFEEGVISFKNLEYYKKKLPTSKFIKPKYEETPERIVFHLVKPLGTEEYRILSEQENIKRDKLVNMVSSTAAMPKLYQALREVVVVAYKMVDFKAKANARELLAKYLVYDARMALMSFLDGARQEASLSKSLDETEVWLRALMKDLIVCEAAGVWHVTECGRMGRVASKAIEQVAVERKAHGTGR